MTTKKGTDKKAPATKKSETKLKAEDQGKLQEFLVDSFKDIYYAENEIQKGLKKMETAATSKELKSRIKKHPDCLSSRDVFYLIKPPFSKGRF